MVEMKQTRLIENDPSRLRTETKEVGYDEKGTRYNSGSMNAY